LAGQYGFKDKESLVLKKKDYLHNILFEYENCFNVLCYNVIIIEIKVCVDRVNISIDAEEALSAKRLVCC